MRQVYLWALQLVRFINLNHSILILRFAGEIDIYSQLDTIETCPHIKQWKLNILNGNINEKIIQRLNEKDTKFKHKNKNEDK